MINYSIVDNFKQMILVLNFHMKFNNPLSNTFVFKTDIHGVML